MSTETSTISIFPERHFSKTNNQFGETLFFFGKWQLFVLVSLRSASPTKCQAISRVFVSRTLLARTCLSVTSHLVQVVGVPRSLFSWCPERDSKRLSCMFCAHPPEPPEPITNSMRERLRVHLWKHHRVVIDLFASGFVTRDGRDSRSYLGN